MAICWRQARSSNTSPGSYSGVWWSFGGLTVTVTERVDWKLRLLPRWCANQGGDDAMVVNEWATGASSIIASSDAIVGSCSSWGRDGRRGSAAIHHGSKLEIGSCSLRPTNSRAVQVHPAREEKERMSQPGRARNRGGRGRGESTATGHCPLVTVCCYGWGFMGCRFGVCVQPGTRVNSPWMIKLCLDTRKSGRKWHIGHCSIL